MSTIEIPDTITIARPDDWHLHLRDGAAMASVLPHSARQFARAIDRKSTRLNSSHGY